MKTILILILIITSLSFSKNKESYDLGTPLYLWTYLSQEEKYSYIIQYIKIGSGSIRLNARTEEEAFKQLNNVSTCIDAHWFDIIQEFPDVAIYSAVSKCAIDAGWLSN